MNSEFPPISSIATVFAIQNLRQELANPIKYRITNDISELKMSSRREILGRMEQSAGGLEQWLSERCLR
jgi:hypothetical protein